MNNKVVILPLNKSQVEYNIWILSAILHFYNWTKNNAI